jgi:hypothetical protein
MLGYFLWNLSWHLSWDLFGEIPTPNLAPPVVRTLEI